MEKINSSKFIFNRELFNIKEIYCISCDKFWDGGFEQGASLTEKSNFYYLANQFSDIIKSITNDLDECILIGHKFSEKECIFEKWKDLGKYDSFNNLKNYINKKSSYKLVLPKDNEIIDYIIENNFRYFTSIDLYLPKNKVILQPTCHSEVFVYSKNYDILLPAFKAAINNRLGFYFKKGIFE